MMGKHLDGKALVTAISAMAPLDEVAPDEVIEAAKDPASPLHAHFEWNIGTAAYQHWVETARGLIRRAREVVYLKREPMPATTVVPVFVSNPRVPESSYISVTKVRGDFDLSRDVLAAELTRCLGNLRRAEGLAKTLGFNLGLGAVVRKISKTLEGVRTAEKPAHRKARRSAQEERQLTAGG
jgi:hypothetical protein